jgi:hypothetical protein
MQAFVLDCENRNAPGPLLQGQAYRLGFRDLRVQPLRGFPKLLLPPRPLPARGTPMPRGVYGAACLTAPGSSPGSTTLDDYEVAPYRDHPQGWLAEIPASPGCYASATRGYRRNRSCLAPEARENLANRLTVLKNLNHRANIWRGGHPRRLSSAHTSSRSSLAFLCVLRVSAVPPLAGLW